LKKDQKNEIKQSFNETIRALVNVIKSMYALAPCAVIVGIILISAIIWVTLQWSPLMIATASLLVFIVSVGILVERKNFGEAMLSLVGGWLTIFAFEWTPERYIPFMTIWFGFAFFAFLISSGRLFSKTEEIYKMAALRIVYPENDYEQIEKRLREIAKTTKLHPIDRAEIIRIFAFRKLPIDLFEPSLKAVEKFFVITQVDIKTIALFFADIFLVLNSNSNEDILRFGDEICTLIMVIPVPPEEFFLAFKKSRKLLVSQKISLNDYLEGLKKCLTTGISSDEVYNEMLKIYSINH
jgi:hypothetical protein